MDRSDVVPWTDKERSRVRRTADVIDRERGGKRRTRRRLVEALFAMGPRIQKVAALKWETIDREAMVVRISEQIARSSNRAARTKGREPRSATVLHGWWEFHEDDAVGLIFPGPDGEPIPYRTLYGYVREVLERAGVKELGIAAHQFRHTYAFMFLGQGGTLDELSKCLGHEDLRTTKKYYDHWSPGHAARSGAEAVYGRG